MEETSGELVRRFVVLARIAGEDKGFDIFFHVGPVVIAEEFLVSPVETLVTRGRSVVKLFE